MTLEELIVYTQVAGQYRIDKLMTDGRDKVAWIDRGGTHEVQIDYNTYDGSHEFESASLYRKRINSQTGQPIHGSMAYPVRKLTLDELCEWVENDT